MCRHDSTAQRLLGALEVADIFRAYGDVYRATHPLAGQQLRVMRAIEQCRTSALGGRLLQCDHCGAYEARYHSCRNRHCPKCQPLAKARWVEAAWPTCCPSRISTVSLPFPTPSILWHREILVSSTPSCSRAPGTRCTPSGVTRAGWAGAWGPQWSCIPGAKTWTSISTCIVS